MTVTLTVFFDPPFYAGLVERVEAGELSAAKVVFGAEPSDPEVYAWILSDYQRLRFSPGVEGVKEVRIADNPKRRQRQAAKAETSGIGTKSQQALALAREENKLERKTVSREYREQEEARRFLLRQEKKKARHRGH